MILQRLQQQLKMKHIGKLEHVLIKFEDHRVVLLRLSQQTLLELRRTNRGVTGVPAHYSFMLDTFEFFPCPDKDYELLICYYPPLVEK